MKDVWHRKASSMPLMMLGEKKILEEHELRGQPGAALNSFELI